MTARVEVLRLATAAHMTGAVVYLDGITPIEGLLILLFIGATRRAPIAWSVN